jgi:hypothetical protein
MILINTNYSSDYVKEFSKLLLQGRSCKKCFSRSSLIISFLELIQFGRCPAAFGKFIKQQQQQLRTLWYSQRTLSREPKSLNPN